MNTGCALKKVLTIAGSDCSGGAGIQADLKTMLANGVYGMSVITALTAQNTMGVKAVWEVDKSFLESQMDAVFEDIIPDAVKIGMVSSKDLIRAIAGCLKRYGAGHIVVDPVMVATSGASLITDGAARVLTEMLFPLARIITPNIPEAELLVGCAIRGEEDMEKAALRLHGRYGCSVLVKGGHLDRRADDVLCSGGKAEWLRGEWIDNSNTHGTGCTLSSAIACGLAKGFSERESVERAKAYVTEALRAGLDLGKGSGPLHHGAGYSPLHHGARYC